MNRRQAGIEATLTKQLSKGGKCLVPYITGGYTGYLEAISAAAEAGADAIEIGIPFSDPVMDGPTIQKANNILLLHKCNFLSYFFFSIFKLKKINT